MKGQQISDNLGPHMLTPSIMLQILYTTVLSSKRIKRISPKTERHIQKRVSFKLALPLEKDAQPLWSFASNGKIMMIF